MITDEAEARLLQCIEEMGRGVQVLRAQLREGNFIDSKSTASLLGVLVQLAEQTIKTGRTRAAAPPADASGSDSAG
jgi:hypothetical protein